MKDTQVQLIGIGAGTLFNGRYYIARRCGQGGMGTVYEARDRELNDELCALKVLETNFISSKTDIERFRNEVLLTRKLTHPNIVRTYEFGQVQTGQYFITMEFVDGPSLENILDRESGPELSFADIIHTLYEVAKGIAYAHDKGVVHRDLKSANVLISKAGEVKIVDFGLATSNNLRERLTHTGECIGTPSYMAPEQVEHNDAGPLVDIYALGVIAYELVSGNLPFHGENWYELANRIINDPLPPMTPKAGSLPKWFEAFVARCTAKDPSERYQSAAEVVDFLLEHLDKASEVMLPNRRLTTHKDPLPRPEINIRTFTTPIYRFSPIIAGASLLLAILLATLGTPEEDVKTPKPEPGKEGPSVIDVVAETLYKLNRAVEITYKNRDKIDKYLSEVEKDAKNIERKILRNSPQENPKEKSEPDKTKP